MARTLYEPQDNSAALAGMFGLKPEDFDSEDVEIWPENQPAVNLFSSISNQWRIGMNGATGLDYNVLFARMDRLKLSDQEYEWMFDDIRTIERVALAAMNKKD